MKKRSTISRWSGWLASIAAAGLIVLAVLVGIARLLLPMAPEYQDDIRRFANEATGFDVQFAQLSASWPLHGPEIRFLDVHVRTRDGRQPVLDAAELSVGINLLQLVTERRLLPGRVAVRQADVRIERLPDGKVLVNAVPLEDLLRQPRSRELPRLDLELRDIGVLLHDAGRLVPDASLMTKKLDLRLAPDSIGFDGELEGRDELGRGFEFAGTLPAAMLPGAERDEGSPAPEWSFSLAATDVEVGRALRLLTNQWVPLKSGRGQLEIELAMSGLVPRQMNLDLELGETQIESAPGVEDTGYRQLGLSARWKRSASGWQANVDRLLAQRGKKASKAGSMEISYALRSSGAGEYKARAEAIRLADIWPLFRSVASSGLRNGPLPEKLLGEVQDFELGAEVIPDKPATWQARATLKDIGLVMPAPGWALAGVSGRLQANERGGQIDVDAGEGLLRLPWLFRVDLHTTRTQGLFAWKFAPAGLQLYTDELRISNAEIDTRTRLSVTLPPSGSPYVDVKARVVASSAPAVVNHLPLVLFSKPLVKWLDESIITGRVPKGELIWRGPLRAFPYDEGDGQFRVEFSVEDGVLDYAPGWPRLENLATTVVIDHNSLSSQENLGTIAGVPFRDAQVRVANLMHKPELQVATADDMQLGQVLAFLRASPIAQTLGPTLNSVSGRGKVTTAVQLTMPIARPRDFHVTGSFAASGASLGLNGVAYRFTDLNGVIRLDDTRLSAEKLSGRFLNEPVAITLRPAGPDEPELSHVAELRGATPADKLAAAFSLPYAEHLDGSVNWTARALVPKAKDQQPFRVDIESDLAGLVSTLGAPLQKTADTREPLQMAVLFPERGQIDISGSIRRGISWALRFTSLSGAPWRLERGNLHSGSPLATLPGAPGVEVTGSFRSLRFEDWFAGAESGTAGAAEPGSSPIRQILVDVDRLSIFGQLFRGASIKAAHAGKLWTVGVRSRDAEGLITVPDVLSADKPLKLDMQRLWLQETDPASGKGRTDPRNLPPVRADVADFALGDMKLGHLKADLAQRGDGVVVEPLGMQADHFSISGNGTWVVVGDDVTQQRSELHLKLESGNIKPTLVAFGYDPVIEGEKATVALDLFWPGGPSENFLTIAGGRVVISLRNGQILPVDPGGGGRLVGLLSIATLPRRLSLDFSDLTDKGLSFDRVSGEFRFDNGTAFTCNMALDGPVTDMGILGQVNFPKRTYDQVAVVRPHVTDVLALGAVAGGPVIGGAVVLISQIFRRSLSSFGESYYRVSGSWDKPDVLKVQRDEVDLRPFSDCERYYAEMLRQLPPEGELGEVARMEAEAVGMISVLPSTLPSMNLLLVFGILLAFGTLGGLLAARIRWLPTITGFMTLGLIIGPTGIGILSQEALNGARVLVDIALGLILFQLGAALHPWLVLKNRALIVTSLVESGLTFIAIFALAIWIGSPPVVAVLAAAISVSSSPAVLMHVAHELHAKGPTVDAAESLVAMNNVVAFVLFSLTLPFALADSEVSLLTAMLLPVYQMIGAIAVSIAAAWVITRIALLTTSEETHFRFALVVGGVMLSLGLAQALQVSSLFAVLTLGIACRWLQGESRLTRVGFGGGGDVFFIILFVFAGANLHLHDMVTYAPVAAACVLARTLAKTTSIYGCGLVFGYSHRQSIAVGLLLVPMAGLAIGLAQTTSSLMPELGAQVSALVLSAVAVFETLGPPVAALALRMSGDAGRAAPAPTPTPEPSSAPPAVAADSATPHR